MVEPGLRTCSWAASPRNWSACRPCRCSPCRSRGGASASGPFGATTCHGSDCFVTQALVLSRAPVPNELPAHCVSRHVVRVRFGETDLMGIVHHGTYISYFEVGRVEYMRRRGLDYNSWTELGIHLPVVEAF